MLPEIIQRLERLVKDVAEGAIILSGKKRQDSVHHQSSR
jgi:hypothetical protein